MVFVGPILVKPWTMEDVAAATPAAFFLGFDSRSRFASGGVVERTVSLIDSPVSMGAVPVLNCLCR